MPTVLGVIVCDMPWRLQDDVVHLLVARFKEAVLRGTTIPATTRMRVTLERTRDHRRPMKKMPDVVFGFSTLLEINEQIHSSKIRTFQNPKATEIWVGIGSTLFCRPYAEHNGAVLKDLTKRAALGLVSRLHDAKELHAYWVYSQHGAAEQMPLGPI